MSTVNIVLLVILAVLIVGLIVLYFLGKTAQKKRAGGTACSQRPDRLHADHR